MRRKRSTMRKERIIMLASSVFVLTALTMTGYYVKEKNETENDGYVVDMSTLEKRTEDKTKEIAASLEKGEAAGSLAKENDLDYDPSFQEASSGDVMNPWDASVNKDIAGAKIAEDAESMMAAVQAEDAQAAETSLAEVADESLDEVRETAALDAAQALSFQEKDNLAWPVAGNVLINYSMDKTVYFPTLQQYKYSPAIVIAASEGENITAAADGRVLSVFQDAQIGQAVKVDVGNGYELTYGQLQDIMVLQGDVISTGDIIGKVAAPTKYYSVEGANAYFALSKDGVPVNPLSWLE